MRASGRSRNDAWCFGCGRNRITENSLVSICKWKRETDVSLMPGIPIHLPDRCTQAITTVAISGPTEILERSRSGALGRLEVPQRATSLRLLYDSIAGSLWQ